MSASGFIDPGLIEHLRQSQARFEREHTFACWRCSGPNLRDGLARNCLHCGYPVERQRLAEREVRRCEAGA